MAGQSEKLLGVSPADAVGMRPLDFIVDNAEGRRSLELIAVHRAVSRPVTDLLCPEGVLTRRGPSAEEIAEIDYGWPIAEALGRFDIGQCIVVKQGMVVAVECLEGTDAALRRGGELRGEGCVAIKRFKPKQDERVDLPSIGLQTVRLLIEQHYRCLAVDAGKTLFFDRAEALALADKHNFCIVALTEDSFGKLRLQAKAD